MNKTSNPGLIVLIGSGETQPSSSKIHEYIAQQLPPEPRIAVLETPAGFELNSDKVAGRIKTFLVRRLQNYNPDVNVIAARKRGTKYSPDNKDVVAPLFFADEILLGPGSPTYCIRQLKDSLAYHILRSRHRLGAVIFLSSAATISFGAFSIPVYEIYKVGEEPFWKPGLNFFGDFGMNLAVVPHWNNNDGGEELDTSHCYIGGERFNTLQRMLPSEVTILGIDDNTSVVMDLNAGRGCVFGSDSVTIIQDGLVKKFHSGDEFPLSLLGEINIPDEQGIPASVWEEALEKQEQRNQKMAAQAVPGQSVLELVRQREAARERNDWQTADKLRDAIKTQGWRVVDTQNGPEIYPTDSQLEDI